MKTKTLKAKRDSAPYHWVLPAFLMLLIIYIVPIIEVFRMSFTNQKVGKIGYSYTIANYVNILTGSDFYNTMGRTLIFVAISVTFQVGLGLLVALGVDYGEKLQLRGTVAVRTLCMISMVIPGVVIGIIWNLIYMESANGLLSYYFGLIGLQNIQFLSNPDNALLSASVANIWRGTGSSMILCYAAVKTIPLDIVEAATVDGANAIKRFFCVRLPFIANMILIVVFLGVIGTLSTFDMIMSLTGGGPGDATEVIALSIYRYVFNDLNISKGSALAVIMLFINLIMALIYFRATKKVSE